jgi:hypothetical protein
MFDKCETSDYGAQFQSQCYSHLEWRAFKLISHRENESEVELSNCEVNFSLFLLKSHEFGIVIYCHRTFMI